MLPDRIAQYTVLSRLGAGGMGEVFLGEDRRLQRRVAIKRVRPDVLDQQAGRRLLTEARAAARLDHPNICPIHEVGEDEHGPFIVMSFIEGETLAARIARGRLAIEEAIAIAAAVADALGAAHAHGILHRDVKPANIMIDTRGQARVMDFGLAKMAVTGEGGAADLDTVSRLTATGSTLGTAGYMSPEQARAETVDARSDLFSLGVVLYEAIGGQRPFDGPSLADTFAAVLTREPLPLARVRPETPDELQRIVSKALRKKKDERYQTASDFAVDLRALARTPSASPMPVMTPAPPASSRRVRPRTIALVAAGLVVATTIGYTGWLAWRGSATSGDARAVPQIQSIAVLPLTNMSPDPSQDYVAEGMTEALTTELARIKSLRVLSRTSTMQYKGTMPRMPEIAKTLGADALVEGSVIRDGDRLRITAQLIHGPTDRHLWADSYDGDLRDVLGLQRRVAEAIAREVRAAITTDDRAGTAATRAIDPRAQDAYLRGRQRFYAGINVEDSRRSAMLLSAIDAYEEALRIEPDWAEAWAGIASARHWMVSGGPDTQALFQASREAAIKAIALDDRVAAGHGALAYVSAANDGDFVTAEREFKRALELGSSSGHQLGYGMMLSALGRFDEARAMFDDAAQRDPLGVWIRIHAAWSRLRAGHYDEAIAQARDLSARLRDRPEPYEIIGWALSWQNRHEEAVAEFARAMKQVPTVSMHASQAAVLARAGRMSEARAELRAIERNPGSLRLSDLARIYACLGDRERALATLEQAFVSRTSWLASINVEPAFESIRNDARFQALLRRAGVVR